MIGPFNLIDPVTVKEICFFFLIVLLHLSVANENFFENLFFSKLILHLFLLNCKETSQFASKFKNLLTLSFVRNVFIPRSVLKHTKKIIMA